MRNGSIHSFKLQNKTNCSKHVFSYDINALAVADQQILSFGQSQDAEDKNLKQKMASPAIRLPYRMVDWFDSGALASAIEAHFALKHKSVKDEPTMYSINEAFGGMDPYWKIYNNGQFASTEENGVLYRPAIVNDIVGKIEHSICHELGVMVRGPPGVGKSLSLVNVIRKLESTGNYLVTYIPDCQTWLTIDDLYDAICRSFGSTKEALNLGSDFCGVDEYGMCNSDDFIDAVDTILEREGKKWVLIFDQVNCLFERLDRKDVRNFLAPFYRICRSIRHDRITSVISVSANNVTVFEDDQRDFEYYDHPFEMAESELLLAFPQLMEKSETDFDNLLQLTGTMPLQVYRRLQAGSDKKYRIEELNRISTSLRRFKEGNMLNNNTYFWECIVESAISCFLQTKDRYKPTFFNRNVSVVKRERCGDSVLVPIHPLVLDAYDEFFRDDLMKFMDRSRGWLLTACRDPGATDDFRGRMFKLLELLWARNDRGGELSGSTSTDIFMTEMM